MTDIGDQGVVSLLAQPGMFKSLKRLELDSNQITDAGCDTLASALRGGALPALHSIHLRGNPVSEEAIDRDRARQR